MTPEKCDVILIEDDKSLSLATMQTLELDGLAAQAFGTAEEAERWITRDFAGIVITDVKLPARSGLEFMQAALRLDPDIPVIVVTGHGDVEMAVEAMRAGAYDFIEKPFNTENLLAVVNRAREKRRLVLENRHLRELWSTDPATPALIGRSDAMERLRTLIRGIGPTSADVLINGATGSGKEVVARQLHMASGRKGPFVAINCGALPESMFETEMFGHEPGSFTGAQKRRIGKIEYANEGTLFLDEIESMPMQLQIKLLRVLQERRLERLGSNQSIEIDCRVIAASKADLLAQSAEGRFREDLYYRISVATIELPALGARREDIPELLAYFMNAASVRYQRPIRQWTPQQMETWRQAKWPGNVRELRNAADRWVLDIDPAADRIDGAATAATLPQLMDRYERELIENILAETDGNVSQAAERLGIPKKTLYDKLKKHALGNPRMPSGPAD
ncbi:MAG TPA: sigma-54 dependent transcriptional regulator [Herbaspirillum sp.]|jgi:two-component system C4-dicarboxylate transport response regulator DctD